MQKYVFTFKKSLPYNAQADLQKLQYKIQKKDHFHILHKEANH